MHDHIWVACSQPCFLITITFPFSLSWLSLIHSDRYCLTTCLHFPPCATQTNSKHLHSLSFLIFDFILCYFFWRLMEQNSRVLIRYEDSILNKKELKRYYYLKPYCTTEYLHINASFLLLTFILSWKWSLIVSAKHFLEFELNSVFWIKALN